MNTTPVRFLSLMRRGSLKRGVIFGAILLLALVAFEIFNYSTTEFALNDMLGANLRFLGVRWATILALAFCGIDFAGIARLFTPQPGKGEASEVWYLFGAWLLAAAMNAILTWWGVAVAVRTHTELSTLIVNQKTLSQAVPIFVALMVWLIRVLIIGTFSMAGDRMFSFEEHQPSMLGQAVRRSVTQPVRTPHPAPAYQPERPRPVRPSPQPQPLRPAPKPEPSYHPVGMAASPRDSEHSLRG
jgi:hypothetical protein